MDLKVYQQTVPDKALRNDFAAALGSASALDIAMVVSVKLSVFRVRRPRTKSRPLTTSASLRNKSNHGPRTPPATQEHPAS